MASYSKKNLIWQLSQEIALIEFFRDHDFLWDIKHNDYYKKNLRESAILNVCLMLGQDLKGTPFTAPDVKDKFKNLRAVFGRELAKVEGSKKAGAEGDDVYKPRWIHYERFSFLKDVFKARQHRDHLNPSEILICDVRSHELPFESEGVESQESLEELPSLCNDRVDQHSSSSSSAPILYDNKSLILHTDHRNYLHNQPPIKDNLYVQQSLKDNLCMQQSLKDNLCMQQSLKDNVFIHQPLKDNIHAQQPLRDNLIHQPLKDSIPMQQPLNDNQLVQQPLKENVLLDVLRTLKEDRRLDAEDYFCLNIAATLKRLPLLTRERAKLEIQRLLLDFQLQASQE